MRPPGPAGLLCDGRELQVQMAELGAAAAAQRGEAWRSAAGNLQAVREAAQVRRALASDGASHTPAAIGLACTGLPGHRHQVKL